MKTINPSMTAESRYSSLTGARNTFLYRARQASSLTIPGLVPPEGATGGAIYETPFQSVGARGVNNLAAKLLLALLPPGTSFFRLAMDDFVVAELMAQAGGEQEGQDARAEFEKGLASVERAVTTRLEQTGARTNVFEALKLLLVAGNITVQMLDTGRLKLHFLQNFVVKRDLDGNVLELVVRETLSKLTLPPEVREVLERRDTDAEDANDEDEQDTLELFTRVSRVTRPSGSVYWTSYQECKGQIIESTRSSYPLDSSPWMVLRFTQISGEDYGRGFVEEYQGDLNSLEVLTEAIVRFSAVAAKIVFFADEGGTTDKIKVARAKSGDFVDGNAKDITVLMLEKMADFQVAKSVAEEMKLRLEQAFLLDTSVQRNAERVTAEEIRLLANALEAGMGGFYSILGEEFQRPLVTRLMLQMQRARQLPNLPKEAIRPQIVTGLEALGRNADLQRLNALGQGIVTLFGQAAAAEYINVGAFTTRTGTALGVDLTGIVRSETEVQQTRAQAVQREMIQKLGPHALAAAQRNAQQSPGAADGAQDASAT